MNKKNIIIIGATSGFNNLALTEIGPQLQEEVNRLSEFINLPRAFDETPEIEKADTKRDALWKALWYAWHYVMQLDPTDPLGRSEKCQRRHSFIFMIWLTDRRGMCKRSSTVSSAPQRVSLTKKMYSGQPTRSCVNW